MPLPDTENKIRACGYCGQTADLTNEHVIPDCFQKTMEAINEERRVATLVKKIPQEDISLP